MADLAPRAPAHIRAYLSDGQRASNSWGWQDQGHVAFDDTVGEVSGTWVALVDDIAAAVEAIIAHGGKIVQPIRKDAPMTATFSDPAGNVFGLYQES